MSMTREDLVKCDPMELYRISEAMKRGHGFFDILLHPRRLTPTLDLLKNWTEHTFLKVVEKIGVAPLDEKFSTYKVFTFAVRELFKKSNGGWYIRHFVSSGSLTDELPLPPKIDLLSLPRFQQALIALTADDLYEHAQEVVEVLVKLEHRLKIASVIRIKRVIMVPVKKIGCSIGAWDSRGSSRDDEVIVERFESYKDYDKATATVRTKVAGHKVGKRFRDDGTGYNGAEERIEERQLYDLSEFSDTVRDTADALRRLQRDRGAIRDAQTSVACTGKALGNLLCQLLITDQDTHETYMVNIHPELVRLWGLGKVIPRQVRRSRRPPGIGTFLSDPPLLPFQDSSLHRRRGRPAKKEAWPIWLAAIDRYLAKTSENTRRFDFDADGRAIIDLSKREKRYDGMPDGVVPLTLAEFFMNFVDNKNKAFQPSTKDWRTFFKDQWADFRREVLVEEPPKGKIEGHSGFWRIGP